jgi:hypothetical protein
MEPSRVAFEGVADTWKRLQIAALKSDVSAGGKTDAQKQLDVLQEQLQEMRELNGRVANIKPAVGR